MSSDSDDKTRESPDENRKGRVVEDQRGHQLWQGTIKTIKLSLMKTGIFYQSEAQQRLIKLRKAGTGETSDDLDDDLEFIDDDGGGFDPYDSAKKK